MLDKVVEAATGSSGLSGALSLIGAGYKLLNQGQSDDISQFKKDFYNPPTDYYVKKKPKKRGRKKRKREMSSKSKVISLQAPGSAKKFGRRKRKRSGRGVSKSVKKYVRSSISKMPVLGLVQSKKSIDSTQQSSPINQCSYNNYYINNRPDLDALCSTFRSTASVTQQNTTSFRNHNGIKGTGIITLHVRNNHTYPQDLRFYRMVHRDDTAVPFNTLLTRRHQDADIGVTGATNVDSNAFAPNAYPSDSKLIRDHFKCLKGTVKVRLNPGDEYTFTMKLSFRYNPDEEDADSQLNYAKKTGCIVIRQIGIPCHDANTETAVGYSPSEIDIIIKRKWSYRFIGLNEQQQLIGVDVDEGEGENTLDTISTPAITNTNIIAEDVFE